jgi:hypothetical protein
MRALALALILCACGGGGGAAGARPSTPQPTAPSGPAPPGWAVIDEPTFSAWMPTGFETKNQAGGRVFVANKDGISYTVSHRTIGPELDGQVEKVFESASLEFFRDCRGGRLRTQRADTLEHKTVTVDGTCGRGKPAMGQVHVRERELYELYIVVMEDKMDEDELRAFFRAFRVKSA